MTNSSADIVYCDIVFIICIISNNGIADFNSAEIKIPITTNNLIDFTSKLHFPNNWCRTTVGEICDVVACAAQGIATYAIFR